MKKNLPLSERFAAKWEPCLMSGCWLWTDAPDSHGYGRLLVEGKAVSAHRISYRLHFGSLPDEMFVCHKCDTPACVNPAHFFLGTAADNTADMDAKGRRRTGPHRNPLRGSQRARARLTEALVDELRARIARGERFHQGDEARRLGVAQSALSRALTGVTWQHVATPPARLKRAHGHGLSRRAAQLERKRIRAMKAAEWASEKIAENARAIRETL